MDLRRLVADLAPTGQSMRLRSGVVVSDEVGTVTITVAGSTVEIPGIRHLDSYAPTAGDTVFMLTDGFDILILGKLA
jgi:predicted ribosome-associated RNA-binding protein Tma20